MTAIKARYVAKDWVLRNCASAKGCVGAFLAGSIVGLEDACTVPIGSDIDVIVAVEDAAIGHFCPPSKLWIESVPLEVAYCPASWFTDARSVLREPNFACHFSIDMILWDPTGALRTTYEYVSDRYADEAHVCERLERLHQRIITDNVDFMCKAGALSHRSNGHGMVISGIAQLALIGNLQNPTYKRSVIRAKAFLPTALYNSLLTFMGSQDLSLDVVKGMYSRMMVTFRITVQVKVTPFFGDADISDEMLSLARSVFNDWFARGYWRESVLWLMDLHASAEEAVRNDGSEVQRNDAQYSLKANLAHVGISEPTDCKALGDAAIVLADEVYNFFAKRVSRHECQK